MKKHNSVVYSHRFPTGGAWAEYVLVEDTGLFAVVCDYGHGLYHWPPGAGRVAGNDLRRELARFDADYIVAKFAYDRQPMWAPVFDGRATLDNIVEYLDDAYSDELGADDLDSLKRRAREFVDRAECDGVERAVYDADVELQKALDFEIYDMCRYRPSPATTHFTTVIIPWLQARLREELASEGK